MVNPNRPRWMSYHKRVDMRKSNHARLLPELSLYSINFRWITHNEQIPGCVFSFAADSQVRGRRESGCSVFGFRHRVFQQHDASRLQICSTALTDYNLWSLSIASSARARNGAALLKGKLIWSYLCTISSPPPYFWGAKIPEVTFPN